MPEVEHLMKFWPALVFGGNVLLGWLFWSAKKHFASQATVAELARRLDALDEKTDKRLDTVERDLAVLTSRLEAMPTKESVHRLEVALSRMEGDLQGLASSMDIRTKGIERGLHLLLKCQMEPEK